MQSKRGLLGLPTTPPASNADDVRRTIAAALTGDTAAREAVIDQLACVPAMVRIRHRRMGSPLTSSDLEDVLQNVLLAVWRKLDQWDGRAPMEYWAYGFVSVELRKAVERRTRRLAVIRPEQPLDTAAPAEAGSEIDTERVRLATEQLAAPDQKIIDLKHRLGMTFEDIAAGTDTPTNTVKTRYYRALKRLRTLLDPTGKENP